MRSNHFRRNLSEEFDRQKEFMQQSEEIVLYGRSVLMPVLKCALRDLGVSIPIRVFDKGVFIDNKPVNLNLHYVVILCGMRLSTRQSMEKDVARFFQYYVCFDFFAVYYKWLTDCIRRNCDYEELAHTLVDVRNECAIQNIDSINTSFCNLNCKECSNGMQYRKNKINIPVDKHILSIKRITDVLPIAYCNIQGGEPFLDPHLAERLLLHAENAKIAFFSLATNGTIVPKDKIFRAIKDSGTMLRISDYGSLSAQKVKLIQKAKEFSIPCDIYQRALTWVAYGELKAHGRTNNANREIANHCHFGTKDIMLYDGKLYCCCRTLFANAIGADNYAVHENVIDVLNKFNHGDLYKIITGSNLYSMCDYCDYPMLQVCAAEQISRNS